MIDLLLFIHIPISIVSECVELNVEYRGSNIYQIADPVSNTENLCQKSCQQHPDCDWWSLDLFTWNRYGCWLKSDKNEDDKEIKQGVIFGPKFCGK